jgi:uncharacterized protein (TIGR02117 family)
MGNRSATFPPVLLPVLVALTLMLPGCADFKDWRYLPATRGEERTIHVVSHGWHTGIILSRRDLDERFGFLDRHLGQSPYYEFGWGEADFYQAERNTVMLALKALFWVNDTVMHVVAVTSAPEAYFPGERVVELRVSKTGLSRLERSLHASFRFDGNGRPYPLGRGLYGDSRFFRGEGHYLFTNTCNRWTARMLSAAGVPMDTLFTLLPGSVIRQAEKAGQRYAAPPAAPAGRPACPENSRNCLY